MFLILAQLDISSLSELENVRRYISAVDPTPLVYLCLGSQECRLRCKTKCKQIIIVIYDVVDRM